MGRPAGDPGDRADSEFVVMTLLIARHGQTNWNLAGRWQSTSDIALNAQGRNQAAQLAVLLKEAGYAPRRLISSTPTPLAMAGCGHSFEDTAFVIEWHVLAMFLPSFFTGNLINRFGVLRIM